MKTILILFFLIIFAYTVNAQYITEVIDYTPAPGQFINTDAYGSSDAAQTIIGSRNGLVSLGAFGGYIIFKFENPVENNPDNPFGIDFTVFGNTSNENAEPATVFVMKDENNNGIPDDTWYELAGSDYYFSNTAHTYEITYTNPQQSTASDVPWSDNPGENGFVYANDYHTQPYYPMSDYFPAINQDNYTLHGTKIKAAVDLSDATNIRSYQRVFGYADNHIRGNANSFLPDNPYTKEIENAGGDAFDISWAVDIDGNYVNSDEIDFIKVQCAVNANMAWLGEVSTEISGALDIAPNTSVNGQEDLIVIKDLPRTIYINQEYPIEVFAFNKGRLLSNQNIAVSVDLPGAFIDENNILTCSETGTLTITASFSENPEISSSMTVTVTEAVNLENTNNNNILIYPNPTHLKFQISGTNNANIRISDISGKEVMTLHNYSNNTVIDISNLKPGIYFLEIIESKTRIIKKLIIN